MSRLFSLAIGMLLPAFGMTAGWYIAAATRDPPRPPYPSIQLFPKSTEPVRLAESTQSCTSVLTDDARERWVERCSRIGGFASISRYAVECWTAPAEIPEGKRVFSFRAEMGGARLMTDKGAEL